MGGVDMGGVDPVGLAVGLPLFLMGADCRETTGMGGAVVDGGWTGASSFFSICSAATRGAKAVFITFVPTPGNLTCNRWIGLP